ncbi:hypothetical protein [uncultured Mailhella sp.]|uniref:hypothetical protein n=1 Tax=uncultured Mailhella sp. TaxID=1981031 RepID=UPI0025FF332A|nr:hypothetical protein [uncultured Mailhella sp.]
MTSLSSSSRKVAWLKLVVLSAVTWLFLGEFLPWVYDVVPPLRHSRDQQAKFDISAGAIYYTDVPVSLDSEMASREAVQKAIELRASSM